VLQALIAMDVISQYVMPLPTAVIGALPRIFVDESVPGRFLLTAAETLAAGLLIAAAGVPIGFWLYHWPRMRQAFEPWVAAWGCRAAGPRISPVPGAVRPVSADHRHAWLRRRGSSGCAEDR
jgi:hypothetical protein